MRLAPRTWKLLGLLLILLSVTWFVLGLLVNANPGSGTGAPADEQVGFEITRGCCFAPAMAGLLLGYLGVAAGRRRAPVQGFELLAALGAAAGLMMALVGLAVIAEPTGSEPLAVRLAFGGLFVFPGVVIIVLAGILTYARSRQL